jgi:hypothetical protein
MPLAIVVAGVFPESSLAMPPVAFAHLDCDQYRSIAEAARFLEPLMVEGGVMWFDDYNCLSSATKAVDEVFGGRVKHAPISNKGYVEF